MQVLCLNSPEGRSRTEHGYHTLIAFDLTLTLTLPRVTNVPSGRGGLYTSVPGMKSYSLLRR